jgi:hypothetical protein
MLQEKETTEYSDDASSLARSREFGVAGADRPCIYGVQGCPPRVQAQLVRHFVAVVSRRVERNLGPKAYGADLIGIQSSRYSIKSPKPSLESRNDSETAFLKDPLGAVLQQGRCDSTCCLSQRVERSSIVNASMSQLHHNRACLTRRQHGLRTFGQAGRRRSQAGRERLLIMATRH